MCTIWVRECVIGLIYLILMYLRVPHFFMIDVDYEVHTLPNHCNKHFKPFSYIIPMVCVLFVYCCLLHHATHCHLYPYHTILYLKSYNQN